MLKERVLILGQEVCLENTSELIQEVLGGAISDTTIHRALECYGDKADTMIKESAHAYAEEVALEVPEVVYVRQMAA